MAAGSHNSGREGFTERVKKPKVSGKSYFERKGKKEKKLNLAKSSLGSSQTYRDQSRSSGKEKQFAS